MKPIHPPSPRPPTAPRSGNLPRRRHRRSTGDAGEDGFRHCAQDATDGATTEGDGTNHQAAHWLGTPKLGVAQNWWKIRWTFGMILGYSHSSHLVRIIGMQLLYNGNVDRCNNTLQDLPTHWLVRGVAIHFWVGYHGNFGDIIGIWTNHIFFWLLRKWGRITPQVNNFHYRTIMMNWLTIKVCGTLDSGKPILSTNNI